MDKMLLINKPAWQARIRSFFSPTIAPHNFSLLKKKNPRTALGDNIRIPIIFFCVDFAIRERPNAISEDVLRDYENRWWTAAREVKPTALNCSRLPT